MKTISLINVYGKQNIGDSAIVDVSLSLLNKVLPAKTHLYMQCLNPQEYKGMRFSNINLKPTYSLYGYAIMNKMPLMKIIRFIYVVFSLTFFVLLDKVFHITFKNNLVSMKLKEIKKSEVVIGVGGGYLRSKNTVKDFFGLTLSLIPIYLAKIYNKKIILLPMSFGNFANSTHRQLAYLAINKNTHFLSRDKNSFKELKIVDKKNVIRKTFIPDLVLFSVWGRKPDVKRKYDNSYVVLTAREWMSEYNQKNFEHNLAIVIEYLWNTYKLTTIFVPMSYNKDEDDDNKVACRIMYSLNNPSYFSIKQCENPEQMRAILRRSKYAICTRMHSAILSTIEYTPYISIAYEDKSKGFAKLMNLEEFLIDIKKVKSTNLQHKFEKLINFKNYEKFISIISDMKKDIVKYKTELITKLDLMEDYVIA